VEFAGYWATGDVAVTDSADTPVSLYRRPGSCLLAVVNTAKRDRAVAMELDLDSLGLAPPVTLTDLLTGEALAEDTNLIRMPVSRRNFRLVNAKREQH